MIEPPSHQSFAERSLAWVLEPTPNDKRLNCGKLTEIVIYTNGTISVLALLCHRYDCLKCGPDRKAEIKKKILELRPYWYAVEISEDEYSSIRKRINRAGGKYCAVGGGNKILLLTTKPVIEGSKPIITFKLNYMLNEYLDCEYDYRKRRFKHSVGLFKSEAKFPPITHIKRKYAVFQPKDAMIRHFEDGGYFITSHYGSRESFMVPLLTKRKPAEEVLSGVRVDIAWAEGGYRGENSDNGSADPETGETGSIDYGLH